MLCGSLHNLNDALPLATYHLTVGSIVEDATYNDTAFALHIAEA